MTVDLNKLSPQALSAAMKGGAANWGEWGSAREHIRYSESVETRRRCRCGCNRRATHAGFANGVCLTSPGCVLKIAKWVKTGK